jgi:rubrerythrin
MSNLAPITLADPGIDNLLLQEDAFMAVFLCEKCGEKVDTRCKPKKCPSCSETGTMCKVEAPGKPPKKGK